MAEVVQLWVYLSTTPLFGLTATLVVYLLAHALYTRWQQAPWANPVFWSVVTLAALLTLTGVPYPSYFSGAQFIHFLLGPAVVALAWPLWQRREPSSSSAGAGFCWPALAGAHGRQRRAPWARAGRLDLPSARAAVPGPQAGDRPGGHGHCRENRRHPGPGRRVLRHDRPHRRAGRQVPV
jgi:hypothetical protein